jgi:hypothetical protein
MESSRRKIPGAIVLIVFASARAWACSCYRTTSIEETIAIHPNLVEAEAVSVTGNEATLRITRMLKGKIDSSTIAVGQQMCFASLYPEMMKPKHTYVLPLGRPVAGQSETVVLADGSQGAVASVGPRNGEY